MLGSSKPSAVLVWSQLFLGSPGEMEERQDWRFVLGKKQMEVQGSLMPGGATHLGTLLP